MELAPTADEAAFRAALRAWLAETVPSLPPAPDGREDWDAKSDYERMWQNTLFDAGYAGVSWPEEFGGRGSTPAEELIFLEETEAAGAPYVGCNFVGTLHAGPTIGAEGSDEQKKKYLPGILRGDDIWCQGFSEPEAGSDLASLRTTASRDGDEYVVNGQKMWTSNAQVARYCELLVRTDPDVKKHAGITWLVMPMDAPGIEVRPLKSLTGGPEFSEMFLHDVRIPVENRVGDENDGWRVAMVTFGFERGTAFVSELLGSMALVADLVAVAKELGHWDDAGIRHGLARVSAELDAQWAYTKRNVSRAARDGNTGVGGSIFKLGYHETRHRLGDIAMRILGRQGLAMGTRVSAEDHVEERLYALSLSIAAGTTQIQRNIVGERLLGLPRER